MYFLCKDILFFFYFERKELYFSFRGWKSLPNAEQNKCIQALYRGYQDCCGQVGILRFDSHFHQQKWLEGGCKSLKFSARTCNICNKVFQGILQMKYHQQRVHQRFSIRVCGICLGVFINDDALEIHLGQIHGDLQVVDDISCKVYGKYSPFL